MSNPAAEGKSKEMQDAALGLGRKLLILNGSSESDIDIAFSTLIESKKLAYGYRHWLKRTWAPGNDVSSRGRNGLPCRLSHFRFWTLAVL